MTITSRYFFPFVTLLFLAVHWGNQLAGTYGLMFDEAQYWFWGKHPALGYYSKPPMIAWLMGGATALFGDSNFGVKMLAPVLLILTATTLYFTARRLNQSEIAARWVFVTYLTLPLVTGNAAFFSTDVPLQLFWALALYSTLIALREPENPRYWLLAGFAAGLALLSKYTMVAFAASVFLALVLIPANRAQLRRPWPWLAALVALAVFSSNLWWNAQHQFVTFKHTDDNVISKTIELYPIDMLEFIGAQLFVLGPVLLLALLLSLRHIRRDALLHCFIWPLVIAGIFISLIAGAQAHWIAPAYLAALLLIVPQLAVHRPRWLRASLGIHLLIIVLFYTAPTLLQVAQLKKNPLDRLFVWNQLSEQIKPLIASYPDAVVMTTERKIAAALTYALRDLRGSNEPVYKWNITGRVRDHYDLLTLQQNFSGRKAIVITRYEESYAPTTDAKTLKILSIGQYRFSVFYVPVIDPKRFKP